MQENNTFDYGEAIEALNTLREEARQQAIATALAAVTGNYITRVQAADLLHVHPHTVSRWITASAAEVEAPSES